MTGLLRVIAIGSLVIALLCVGLIVVGGWWL